MKWTRARAAGVFAVGAASALVLSACGGGGNPSASPTVHNPVTLTVSYWGNFGIAEDATGPSLESVYEESHPWVTLELNSSEYDLAHDNLAQALIVGSGAPNVAAIDDGYITQFVAQSDSFVNLVDLGALDHQEDYLPWKWAQAANVDNSVVLGLGNDVYGLGMCYRADLFEAAGLESDREAVSAAIGESWEDFIAEGEAYTGETGSKFIDNATSILNPALIQLGTGYAYYNLDDELDMDSVKPAFDIAVDAIEADLSAGLGNFTDDWKAALTTGDFAITTCPTWMLDYIKSQVNVDDYEGQWDLADIPGPGGNWGGSFFTIPNQGTEYEQKSSYALIEWLIQPDQQRKMMEETGKLPSLVTILESDDLSSYTNTFFNDVPYNEVLAKTVLDIPVAVYYAPNNNLVRYAVEGILDEVQLGNVAIADAWDTAVAAAVAADEDSI